MTARVVEASPASGASILPSLPEARKLKGRSLRQVCPRSSHGHMILGQAKRDPLTLLEESNRDRIENLLPVRFTRMAESAFAFFRGTAVLQAHDLQGTPSAGISVQCCGDCHLMNFGGFATPERALVFDMNDFDETLAAPFEWDLKRLATSFVLAGRWLGFKEKDSRNAAFALSASYRATMARFAEMSVLDVWYTKITYDDLLESARDEDIQKMLKKRIAKAMQSTSEYVFHKLTKIENGRPRIAPQPPLLFRPEQYDELMNQDVVPFFERYRDSLPPDKQVLFDRYRIIDFAFKVVGVGSVGTRCMVVLLLDDQDAPLFLQVKEARPSVLHGRASDSRFANEGERVVIGQRLMQCASDIFLGWSRGPAGRDCYVRQLRDMKIAPRLTDFSPRHLETYAFLCGKTLARAHAKTGDASTIAGYLGSSEIFDEALAEYSVGYADQVQRDYQSFLEAARLGRFPLETVPSELEEMIR